MPNYRVLKLSLARLCYLILSYQCNSDWKTTYVYVADIAIVVVFCVHFLSSPAECKKLNCCKTRIRETNEKYNIYGFVLLSAIFQITIVMDVHFPFLFSFLLLKNKNNSYRRQLVPPLLSSIQHESSTNKQISRIYIHTFIYTYIHIHISMQPWHRHPASNKGKHEHTHTYSHAHRDICGSFLYSLK